MFTPIKNKKVYEQVIEQIQAMIMEGKLKKGDKLLSERELAEQLQVSRPSIREALRALEIIGLIETRQGEGNFISGSVENSFFQPLSVLFMLNNGRSKDILELRVIIEVQIAGLAARRMTDEHKRELEELMSKLREAETEEESARIDKALHYKIAMITENYLLISLLQAISSLMESFIGNARIMILKNTESKNLLTEQHQRICCALIAEDSLEAERAMEEHLESINNIIEDLEYEKHLPSL